MQLVLKAKSNDEGGITASFEEQLQKLGGEAELVDEKGPYRVDSSNEWYFEVERTYEVTL